MSKKVKEDAVKGKSNAKANYLKTGGRVCAGSCPDRSQSSRGDLKPLAHGKQEHSKRPQILNSQHSSFSLFKEFV